MSGADPVAGQAPGQDPAPAPACYRHPGRQTWIRCARCDRPVCPDCMVPASVGFQCPQCVAEGRRAQPRVRNAFGGRPTTGALVTYTLIAVNVVAFVAEKVLGARFTNEFFMIGYVPNFPGGGLGVAEGQWWRLLTSAFLHDPNSLLHIGFNMYALYVLGPPVEMMLGRSRYLALYLLAALGGSAVSYLWLPQNQPSLGASGAIFGLFSAWIVLARKRRLDARPMWILLAVNLVLGFVVPNIDWHAHLGGLVVGGAVTAAYAYAPRGRWRLPVQAGTATAVLVLVLVRTAVRTTQLLG